MKLILYCWDSNIENILYQNLIKLGHDVIKYSRKCNHLTRDLSLAQDLIPFIHQNACEGIVSFNFFPIVSMVCQTVGIPYYSWVYDCPHLTLYSRQTAAACNHIGIFDAHMVASLKEYGITGAFHLPLAVDSDFFLGAATASVEDSQRFACDISFVGSLYNDKHNYFDNIDIADSIYSESVEALKPALFDYHESYNKLHWDSKLRNAWTTALEVNGLTLDEDYFATADNILEDCVIGHKLTELERKAVLSAVADKYGSSAFSLFTNSDTAGNDVLNKCNKGIVNYEKEMPIVFSQSRINLNISLRSIQSGIPMRVLDIMACGGFVLTNYQPELEEFFEIGKELVVFEDIEDCLRKIDYYLTHEEERAEIALSGQNAVRTHFSYETLLPKLFE